VQYVKFCEHSGNGFFKLPVTVFCVCRGSAGQFAGDNQLRSRQGWPLRSTNTGTQEERNSYSVNFLPARFPQDTALADTTKQPTFDLVRHVNDVWPPRTVVQPSLTTSTWASSKGGPGPGFEANKTPGLLCYPRRRSITPSGAASRS